MIHLHAQAVQTQTVNCVQLRILFNIVEDVIVDTILICLLILVSHLVHLILILLLHITLILLLVNKYSIVDHIQYKVQ
jgi:hypothetical protein